MRSWQCGAVTCSADFIKILCVMMIALAAAILVPLDPAHDQVWIGILMLCVGVIVPSPVDVKRNGV
jgi:hypothetical protein